MEQVKENIKSADQAAVNSLSNEEVQIIKEVKIVMKNYPLFPVRAAVNIPHALMVATYYII